LSVDSLSSYWAAALLISRCTFYVGVLSKMQAFRAHTVQHTRISRPQVIDVTIYSITIMPKLYC